MTLDLPSFALGLLAGGVLLLAVLLLALVGVALSRQKRVLDRLEGENRQLRRDAAWPGEAPAAPPRREEG